ncbi:MAG: serpin family protein [Oscillospiraceae bacterium]
MKEKTAGTRKRFVNKRNIIIGASSLVVAGAAAFALMKAPAHISAENLMDGFEPSKNIQTTAPDAKFRTGMYDFTASLFRESTKQGDKNKNLLLSPASALMALGMTENGAQGQTAEQMAQALCGMSAEQLNPYLGELVSRWSGGQLNTANSIWFKDDDSLKVKDSFLQTNADYFGADAYAAPFNDRTLKDINNWVSNHTDRQIKKALDEIPEDAALYLVNTILFDAKWESPYEKSDVHDATFTAADGSEQTAEFMYASDDYVGYLQDENTVGFCRNYEDGKYSFAALLPAEGVALSDYINGLTGEKLREALCIARGAESSHIDSEV